MATSSVTETREPAQAPVKEYLLHFVGSKTYGARRFIAEGEKIGVQRAVPFSMLKNQVKFGDVILCAEYKPKEDKCAACHGDGKIPVMVEGLLQGADDCEPCEGKGIIKTPVASVFGYFVVQSLTYQLPEDVKARLYASLDIVGTEVPEGGMSNEQRACGSYQMGATVYVNDDIPELANKIQDAFRGTGLQAITGGKYFLRGPFNVLEAPLILEGCRFIRGYQKVKVPVDLSSGEAPKKAVAALYDYSKKSYMKKSDGEAYDRALAEEHQADLKNYEAGDDESSDKFAGKSHTRNFTSVFKEDEEN